MNCPKCEKEMEEGKAVVEGSVPAFIFTMLIYILLCAITIYYSKWMLMLVMFLAIMIRILAYSKLNFTKHNTTTKILDGGQGRKAFHCSSCELNVIWNEK